MASVHFGRLQGASGFSRTVAIKRLHARFATDRDFVRMFVDEARLVSRIRHSNVVPTLDVVVEGEELFLVMEYIHGEPLSRLLRAVRRDGRRIPTRIVTALVSGMLHGLHAAHDAQGELGQPLGIVHRDVSPPNVIVGADGAARVLDFGVATASARLTETVGDVIKGKLGYMAPEQITRGPVDRRADIYSTGVVLWEILTGEVLFDGPNEAVVLKEVMEGRVPAPSSTVRDLPPALDEIVARALQSVPERRYATAHQMALAVQSAVPSATASEVGEWVQMCSGDALARRAARVADIERGQAPPPSGPWLRDSALVSVSVPALATGVLGSGYRRLAWGGTLAAIGCLLAFWAARSGGAANSTAIAAVPVNAVSTVVPPERDLPSARPPATGGPAASEAPPSEVPAAAPSASASPTVRPPIRTVARPACAPPYVRDAFGTKVWKRECL